MIALPLEHSDHSPVVLKPSNVDFGPHHFVSIILGFSARISIKFLKIHAIHLKGMVSQTGGY